MIAKQKMEFIKDMAAGQVTVNREFDAPVALVWKAWTEPGLLDQWWAPKPWQARTKTMDFREGGYWLYSMNGPDGTQSRGRADYLTIQPQKMFSCTDSFCNEDGVVDAAFPKMTWQTNFTQTGPATLVTVNIRFESEEDLRKIMEMGFEQGFTAALDNLDELFAAQLVH